MNEKKTWADIHKDEVLSDNSQVEYCKQCKTCKHRDDGTVWSNHYTKSNCRMFAYPKTKPLDVINNKGDCPYFESV